MKSVFKVLACAPISDGRQIVISESDDGKIVIATRYSIDTEKGRKHFYEKGSIVLEGKKVLKDFANEILENM